MTCMKLAGVLNCEQKESTSPLTDWPMKSFCKVKLSMSYAVFVVYNLSTLKFLKQALLPQCLQWRWCPSYGIPSHTSVMAALILSLYLSCLAPMQLVLEAVLLQAVFSKTIGWLLSKLHDSAWKRWGVIFLSTLMANLFRYVWQYSLSRHRHIRLRDNWSSKQATAVQIEVSHKCLTVARAIWWCCFEIRWVQPRKNQAEVNKAQWT